jgi:dipeptidyl aminopeptidase/acylaminoacyl peptidase
MSDRTSFEARLAVALDRYADLAPDIDDEKIARAAIASGRPGLVARWVAALRGTTADAPGSFRWRNASLSLLVIVLLAALIAAAVVGGLFRGTPPPLGGNGAIVFSFASNDHSPVVSLAVSADGTHRHSVDTGRCPTYSRDGSTLGWLSNEGSSVYLVVAAPDGSAARRMLLVRDAAQSVPFALSADGSRVAWFAPGASPPRATTRPAAGSGSDTALWVAPIGGTGVAIVSSSTSQGESFGSPLWSPDGRHIAFGISVRDATTAETKRTAIDVVAADGSGRLRLTTRPGRPADGMSWSPDSRHLAYVGLADGATARSPGSASTLGAGPSDLYVVDLDSVERNLTNTPVNEHDPEWSPDGASIAFETSSEGAPDRVTSLGVDGASAVGPPILGPPSSWFVWSPDGRLLLWQELATGGPETFRTTLHSVDRGFTKPALTLSVMDGLIVCPPSWQRLEP